MYNTKVACSYNTVDVFLETDNITASEMEFVRDALYRQELLDILELEEYDEELMSTAIHDLYEKVKESPELRKCMVKTAKRLMTADEEFGLLVLFAYDYMYLTHVCICEYLETGKITQTSMDNLCAAISSKFSSGM
jgi:hypothetical protein